ncbi:MAG: MopE-related protein [Pseudomonadota bacterium]|nr:MopE-related protein [Pseudomonadota bacterium]
MRASFLFALAILPACVFVDKATLDDRLDPDGDGVPWPEDCGPNDAGVFPGATESCDGIDQDCDGEIDEGLSPTWYVDADDDGHGAEGAAIVACEAPDGAVADGDDCDDDDGTRFPGAAEACDGVDQDCDGEVDEGIAVTTWYLDADADGIGGDTATEESCVAPVGYVATGGDCDDDDDGIGAASIWYDDADGDGYGDATTAEFACEAAVGSVADGTDCDDDDARYHPDAAEADCEDPADYNCDGSTGYDDFDGDGWAACLDCDDEDAGVSPDGIEACDGIDDDCSGEVDDEAIDAATWYADADDDGFGGPGTALSACTAPLGYVADASDCDDGDPDVSPAAAEHCDGEDDDCDGGTDESAVDAATWYVDDDGDGYGGLSTIAGCDQPGGYVAVDGDCDDSDADYNPDAAESCSDPTDFNCDGSVAYADADGDGWAACEDCDDAEASVSPAAVETCDGVDDDCDGDIDGGAVDALDWYVDGDGDGYGGATTEIACDAPVGYVANADDCDDDDSGVNPAAVEYCDGVDDDCDGTTDEDSAADAGAWYVDGDLDGYGGHTSMVACSAPGGYVAVDGDCDDADAAISPAAIEVCDAADTDEDCDGAADDADASCSSVGAISAWADSDADGYGDAAATYAFCDVPEAYVVNDEDCDDTDAGVGPSSTWYADADGDGFSDAALSVTACSQPGGYIAAANADCDDSDAATHPGAAASDSATSCMTDADGDGYGDETVASGVTAGTDCDDSGAATNPGATEVCADGVDNDCDGGGSGCAPASGSLSSAAAQFTGVTANDRAGAAVSGGGDVNGDGYGDFLVGAPGRTNGYRYGGAAYLVLGEASPSSRSLSATVEYIGEPTGLSAGNAVAIVGDVDLDGFDDLLIGDPNAGEGGGSSATGVAYLVLGASAPASSYLSSAIDYAGESANDSAASNVNGAGDVNADGFADMLIGATGDDTSCSNAGAGYIVLGSGSPVTESLSSALKFTGVDCGEVAGQGVAGAGDVDGDGVDDFLIGAYSNDDAGTNAGAVYLVLGRSGLSGGSLSTGVQYQGQAAGDQAGVSIAAAGDFDGDGYGDFIVGASDGNSGTGAAYLLLGEAFPGGGAVSSGVQFSGEAADDCAGSAVGGGGDVDGDGYDDVLVGAKCQDDAGAQAGKAYLLLGSPYPAAGNLADNVYFTGEAGADDAGHSVNVAGDVNGDGLPDLLVGAPYNDYAASGAGSAYLILGGGL